MTLPAGPRRCSSSRSLPDKTTVRRISLPGVWRASTPVTFPTTVDEVLDSVDPSTRNFLLKSSLLRSMNDALIVRVTGCENGQLQLEEIERQAFS